MSVFPEKGSIRHSLVVLSAAESVKQGNAAIARGEHALAQGFYSAARRDLATIGHTYTEKIGALEQFARVLAEAGEETLDGSEDGLDG